MSFMTGFFFFGFRFYIHEANLGCLQTGLTSLTRPPRSLRRRPADCGESRRDASQSRKSSTHLLIGGDENKERLAGGWLAAAVSSEGRDPPGVGVFVKSWLKISFMCGNYGRRTRCLVWCWRHGWGITVKKQKKTLTGHFIRCNVQWLLIHWDLL